jgi:hypothetical protein
MGMYGKTTVETKIETSQTTAYSPEVEKALLNIAERSQTLSEEQWALAKQVYEPYERAIIDYNMKMLPQMEQLTTAQLEAQQKGLGLYGLEVEEAQRDILSNREVKDALREQQLQELGLSAPVTEKFYKEAYEGIEGDVGRKMGEATADVTQAYKGAAGAMRREAGRSGTKITADQIRDLALERAKSIAGARTKARETEEQRVEDTNWARLTAGMGARGRATGLSGTQVQSGTSSGVGPTETELGNYGLTSPVAAASNLSSQALSSYGLTTRKTKGTSSETQTESGGEGWGLLGMMYGVAGSAARTDVAIGPKGIG